MFTQLTVFIFFVKEFFLFLLIHLGQPRRAFNVFLHPTLNSMLFWDGNILGFYCLLNIIIGWNVLEAERNGISPRSWVKPLIYIHPGSFFNTYDNGLYLLRFNGKGILAYRHLSSPVPGIRLLFGTCLFDLVVFSFEKAHRF